jgi:hypothetical protein
LIVLTPFEVSLVSMMKTGISILLSTGLG